MNDKEKKELALKECICKNCPSFKECSESIGYCVLGLSKCIKEKKGCICGACPVHEKLKLTEHYYCVQKS